MAETSKETPFGRDNYSASLIANKIQWSVEEFEAASQCLEASRAFGLSISEKYTLTIHEVCPILIIQAHKSTHQTCSKIEN